MRATHRYFQPGSFNFKVNITDNKRAQHAGTSAFARIPDAPLKSVGRTTTALTRKPITQIHGSFFDADYNNTSPAKYRVTINWNDGTTPTVGALNFNRSMGGWDVVGQHTFNKPGTALIDILVKDVGGSQTTIESHVIVH